MTIPVLAQCVRHEEWRNAKAGAELDDGGGPFAPDERIEEVGEVLAAVDRADGVSEREEARP